MESKQSKSDEPGFLAWKGSAGKRNIHSAHASKQHAAGKTHAGEMKFHAEGRVHKA